MGIIGKLLLVRKILAAGKRTMVFYAEQLIVGKATKVSKNFYWRLVKFLIPDTLFFQFQDQNFLYRLGKPFWRVKYDSLYSRVYIIESYLA